MAYLYTTDHTRTNRIFDRLLEHRMAIEARFGVALAWDRRPESNASHICWYLDGSLLGGEEKWPELEDDSLDASSRLVAALRPYVDVLP